MQLDAAFREQWLEALRSPEWEGHETYTTLGSERSERYCAMGLALRINGVPFHTTEGRADDPENPISYSWLRQRGVNPDLCWMVFDKSDHYGFQTMTFAQFADWLEANSEPAE